MECSPTTWLSDKEYLQRFNKKVTQQRIPLSGSLDLTHRCNLRCVHCYLGDKASIKEDDHQELSTAQWISIIDEIVDAGCLYLIITGGDSLLRKDFSEIYRHAKTKGLLVTVFTNGTLITDSILELFDDFPPHAVEITLYGATAAIYESISGINGSYEKCLTGVKRLLDHQINLKLKTILMTLNHHEFYDIENMAREYGVKFRFDATIFPCFNGDKTPLSLRVAPKEAVEREFSDNERKHQWRDFFERFQEVPLTDDLYQCGAGLAMFHIDPYGSLRPCVMVNSVTYDLKTGSFFAGWYEVIPRIREKKAHTADVCGQCEKKILCGYCPGFFKLENGAEGVRSEYLCAMGHYRFHAIEQSNCVL